MKMQTHTATLSTKGHISSWLARASTGCCSAARYISRISIRVFSKAPRGAIGQFPSETPAHFFLEHTFQSQYNRGPGKYTPLANIQFTADWSDLSNPGLQANQWRVYIWKGCIFSWSATVWLIILRIHRVIVPALVHSGYVDLFLHRSADLCLHPNLSSISMPWS